MNKKIYLIVVFLCAISVLIIAYKSIYIKNKQKEFTENVIEYLENIEVQEKSKGTEKEENIIFQNGEIGMIIIPSLELKAPIYEGTSNNVLRYTVRTFYRN